MFHPDVAKAMKHRPFQAPAAPPTTSTAAPPPMQGAWQSVPGNRRSRSRHAERTAPEQWPLPQQSAQLAIGGNPQTATPHALPGTPKAAVVKQPAAKTAASPGKASPATTVVEPPTPPEGPPADGSTPLTQEARALIQQELAQLVTGISALKPIPGYEEVVKGLEAKRHELQKKLHFAKPVKARVEALRAAALKRTQAIEEATLRHHQAVAAVADAERLVEETANGMVAAEHALTEIQTELTQAEALLAHEEASAGAMPDPTILIQQVLLAQASGQQLAPEWIAAAARLVGPPPPAMVQPAAATSPFQAEPVAQPAAAAVTPFQPTGPAAVTPAPVTLVNTPFAPAAAVQQQQSANVQAAVQLLEAQRIAQHHAAAAGLPAHLIATANASAFAAVAGQPVVAVPAVPAPWTTEGAITGGQKREAVQSPLQPAKLQARMDHAGQPSAVGAHPAPPEPARASGLPPTPAAAAPAPSIAEDPAALASVLPSTEATPEYKPPSKYGDRFSTARTLNHGGYLAAPSAAAEASAFRQAGRPY